MALEVASSSGMATHPTRLAVPVMITIEKKRAAFVSMFVPPCVTHRTDARPTALRARHEAELFPLGT
jgi:hypothetical protein